MQTKPFNRFVFTIVAAFVATLLAVAASTARAGLFDIPAEPADWNGPYVNFNSGVVINNFHQGSYFDGVDLTKQFNTGSGDMDGPPDFFDYFGFAGHDSTDTAYSGGIDLGYNKQWGHFVVGLGFGFSGTHTSDKSKGFGFDEDDYDSVDDTYFDTETTSIRKMTENWSGYAGGLVGFAWNRFLFYAIGGSAFAQVDLTTYDVSNTEFFPIGNMGPNIVTPRQNGPFGTSAKDVGAINDVLTGWYAGGGVQFAFSNVLTAGLEFRHNDYGDRRYHPDAHDGVFPYGVDVGLDDNQVLFKVGILLGHLGEKGAPAPAPAN